MNKLISNIMVSSLGILAIIAFAVITMPTKANADSNSAGYVNAYNPNRLSDSGVNSVTSTSSTKAVSTAKTAPTKAVESKPADSTLSANAISAGNSFMPNSIIGWIFIAILILLIVILVRKVIGADKKYHATPLKHA